MATTSKIRSKEMEKTLLKDFTTTAVRKLPIKDNFFNIQQPVVADPIDSIRISKASTKSLTMNSVIKAGIVFLSAVGGYYLAKTTGVFSYFGRRVKNSKDVSSSGTMEIKNRADVLSAKINSETKRQVNSPSINHILQMYKGEDRSVEFEEVKVEEFGNLSKEKKINAIKQRAINIKNSIPNQNAVVGKPFDLTIDGTNVFNSSGALFLEAKNVPIWLNFSNPNPTLKGTCDLPGDEFWGIAIFENYAYIVGDNYTSPLSSLYVIDIKNPSSPIFKGSYNKLNNAKGVAVSGNYAYVADGISGLQIIDISDSSNPTFKGLYNTSSNGVDISGNYACIAADTSGLQIIDISDPSNPTFKGSCDTPNNARGVVVFENYAYVTDTSGLLIIDISNPSNPTFKGSYQAY
jgi:hypothetical protein